MKLGKIDLITVGIMTTLCLSKLSAFSEYTSIVTDEIQYKEIILGMKEAHLFNPMYYQLYEIVKLGIEGWYLGVRFLNLVFIYISAEAIRRICILYNIKGIKRLLVYISMLCTGITTYMLNAMPDCMYIAGVYWTTYVLLKIDFLNKKNTILISSLAGSLALIKPHAIIIYPIILITYICKRKEEKQLSRIKEMVISVTIYMLIRWGIGWITTGPVSFGLFGGTYETLGQNTIVDTLDTTLYIINRHVITWILITPFMASYIYIVAKEIHSEKLERKHQELNLYTIGIFITSIIVYSVFTSKVHTNENMQILRIHLRYYAFIMPLLIVSALNIESKIKSLINKWGLLLINIIAILFIYMSGIVLKYGLTIEGSWIDSQIIVIAENKETLIILITIAICQMLLITWHKSNIIAIYYTVGFLMLSEAKQWIVSSKEMEDSMQATRTYKYIEMETKNESFDVLIKGAEIGKSYNTNKEMIDCIKLAMKQTNRTFQNMCIKDITKSEQKYLLTYSHLNYESVLDKYCMIENLNHVKPLEKNLYVLKDYKWKNIIPENNNSGNLSMIGYHPKENWGWWAKQKETKIVVRQLLNGNGQIRFKARSLADSKIAIGNKIILLNDNWKSITYDLEDEYCRSTIYIRFIGESANTKLRTLTYAIKDIQIENKNY